jgi:hypothetical protein
MEATVKLTLAEYNQAIKDAFTNGWTTSRDQSAGFPTSWDNYFKKVMNKLAVKGK